MFLNAIIFEKLKSVFNQLNTESGRYFLTFSSITTSFNNQDFNFLDNTDTNHQISDKYENQMAFAHLANAIVKNQKNIRVEWRALKKSPFILGKKKGVESAFSTPFFVS